MAQLIINFFILTMSLLFNQMKHPLSLGFILLIQTMLITLTTGLNSKTFWFSYMLFLVFLGGMLVMFIYVVSLSSNEMFILSNKLILFMLISTILIIFMSMMTDMFFSSKMINLEMNPINDNNLFLKENSSTLNKIYNTPTNWTTIMLILYLFLTLIITIKITNFFYGPLRMSFN
uniref:NADH-ubiquinone oxidoreductase chain 6 n=1 Tax=Acnemia nitidicollis TaxID=2339098 RepID=A0A7D7FAQ8_9DIPT|nr:NADH dehydrogenase subunit 6 [Acnemia nitidicollis]QMP96642.1 NADH dehydrogenase subunit 6 [Acnemia nitidicollis]